MSETPPRPIPAPRALVERNCEPRISNATAVTSDHRSSAVASPKTATMLIKPPPAPVQRQEREMVVVRVSPTAARKLIVTKHSSADASNRLGTSLSRLSQSVYGELNDEQVRFTT
ncbi:hypothetical protein OSTOST_19020 [Ostertagia ostertagi]